MRQSKSTRLKSKNPVKTLGRVFSIIFRKHGALFALALICIVFAAVGSVYPSLMLKELIDAVQNVIDGKSAFADVGALIIRSAIIFALILACIATYNQLMVVIAQSVLRDIRNDMFKGMQKLPIKYFDTHPFGDTMSHYTNDTDTLEMLISESIPNIVNPLMSITVCLVYMIINSWQLTIVVLLTVVGMFFVIRGVGGKSAKFFMAQQRAIASVNGYVEEMINGQKVVKVFCYEEKNKQGFDKVNGDWCDKATSANRYANIFMPIMGNLTYVQYAIVAIIGGVLAANGRLITSGASAASAFALVVSFLTVSRAFTMPINTVSQQFNSIVMALAGAERIFELMDEKPETDDGYVTLVKIKYDQSGVAYQAEMNDKSAIWAWRHPHGDGTLTYTELKGRVDLVNVDFSYDGVKQVLSDINIYVEPGQKVALIGKTGAGKTTISNLLNRFYDIDDGKIRYDGININKIKKQDLRRSLGVVLQDVNLFTGTVMENIRYGNPYATDEEVRAAAKLAHADDFIERLPQGYDTVLSGDGANLSQGQRQLISIARVAVADPPVMILDEATSSIDTRTEQLVQSGMDNLMKGRTVFVIAHRLSTIRNSDCIMVMDGGRIIERGNHKQLMEKQGVYYALNK
ncbi:MAG: ABC transporter ATP-binding protein [Clostridia bacterium]|nr:ABC transporter ATP-binding protein [Clostridia bacterium]